MYTVEILTNADFEWAVNVAGKNMIEQEVKRPELYNKERFRDLTNMMIRDGTALIVKENGSPVGVIGSLLTQNMYNPQYSMLVEVIWYVLPRSRGTRVGYKLLKAYRELVDKVADEATLSTLVDSPVNEESLTKLGWKKSEVAYHCFNKER